MLLTNEQYVILFQRYILIFFLDISFNKSQSALNNPYFQNFPKETGFEGFIQVLTQLSTNVIDSYLQGGGLSESVKENAVASLHARESESSTNALRSLVYSKIHMIYPL